jgi:NitT/TauT family transport system ATP-binding protein
MQRRVALLRAFSVAPQLLLMDEPFQSLDAPTADQLRTHLLDLWQDTKPTVLFVTHNLQEALALADRVLFLSAGPSRIALDLPLELPRPRGVDSPAVLAMAQQLLQRYPDLLKGIVT